MRSQEKSVPKTYEAFDAGSHLSGVVEMCRSLNAPGLQTIIAVARDLGEVVAFAQVFGDGVFQAHPGLLAVDEKWRRRGIGRALVQEAYFYRSLQHREQAGFRLYTENKEEEA